MSSCFSVKRKKLSGIQIKNCKTTEHNFSLRKDKASQSNRIVFLFYTNCKLLHKICVTEPHLLVLGLSSFTHSYDVLIVVNHRFGNLCDVLCFKILKILFN